MVSIIKSAKRRGNAIRKKNGGNIMNEFITELRLALEDYFCGKFVEKDGKIIAQLDDGHKFTIKVEEA